MYGRRASVLKSVPNVKSTRLCLSFVKMWLSFISFIRFMLLPLNLSYYYFSMNVLFASRGFQYMEVWNYLWLAIDPTDFQRSCNYVFLMDSFKTLSFYASCLFRTWRIWEHSSTQLQSTLNCHTPMMTKNRCEFYTNSFKLWCLHMVGIVGKWTVLWFLVFWFVKYLSILTAWWIHWKSTPLKPS